MSLTRADLKRRDLLRAAALTGSAALPVLASCASPDPVPPVIAVYAVFQRQIQTGLTTGAVK